jgi:hypothetical protein
MVVEVVSFNSWTLLLFQLIVVWDAFALLEAKSE